MKISVQGSDTAFECGDDYILRAALGEGLGFPYECGSGSCGNCRFELIEGDIVYPHGTPSILTEKDAARNRHLACQCKPTTDLSIKVRLFSEYAPLHQPSTFPATLTDVIPVTHDIYEFQFETDAEQPFSAGQYALIELPGVPGDRAYSMCNTGTEARRWDFQIKKVPNGKASVTLFDEVQVGQQVHLSGPYGRGYFRGFRGRDVVLVAGGSGLSPMVSIARAAATAARHGEQVFFYYGGRGLVDLAGEAFLTPLEGYGDWMHYAAALSDSGDTGSHFKGFVHDLVKSAHGDTLTGMDVYFAGPPLMGAAMEGMIREMKIPSDQVFYDRFY